MSKSNHFKFVDDLINQWALFEKNNQDINIANRYSNNPSRSAEVFQ